MTSPDHADPSPRAPALNRVRERIRDGLGEEVVVDVLLALVAEEGDDVFDVVVVLLEGPGGDQMRPGAGADEQAELFGEASHLGDSLLAVDRDQGVDVAAVAGDDAGHEAVGDAFDQVPANLATHQGAGLVGFDRDDAAARVDRPERLPDADDRAAGADSADDRVGHDAGGQLTQHLRAEPAAVLLDVPLAVELLRGEVARLGTELASLR